MKIIATLVADLDESPIGTRSRLADDLLGRPVLRRTLERVLRAKQLSAMHLICNAAHAERIRPLIDGLDVVLETHTGSIPPYRALVRAGRMWGLDGWRGGIGGLCGFDEDFHVPLLHALADRIGADAVMSIPAAAAVIDPQLLDAMAGHFRDNAQMARLTIVQAPPGLGAFIIERGVLADLAPTGQPPGALLAYQPTNPMPDLTGREGCYRPPAEVVQAKGRLLCDTRRATERVRRLLEAGGDTWDAVEIARWLNATEAVRVHDVPEEIEIELTTEHPLRETSLLRPRCSEVGRRGPITLDVVRSVADWIGDYDDVRVVLGGFGEPLMHERFAEICRILRDAGAGAVAVRTSAAGDRPEAEAALFETPVDVVEVTLDAARAETYRLVNGSDAYDAVLARLERWIDRRRREQCVLPLIVPSLVKAVETIDDLEPFVDTWQRRIATTLVTGYSHCARQRPRRAVTDITPPDRRACRRVFSRTLILADGRLTTCDQDFAGKQAIGRIGDKPLEVLWGDPRLVDIRTNADHQMPLCPTCDEWHRP